MPETIFTFSKLPRCGSDRKKNQEYLPDIHPCLHILSQQSRAGAVEEHGHFETAAGVRCVNPIAWSWDLAKWRLYAILRYVTVVNIQFEYLQVLQIFDQLILKWNPVRTDSFKRSSSWMEELVPKVNSYYRLKEILPAELLTCIFKARDFVKLYLTENWEDNSEDLFFHGDFNLELFEMHWPDA